MKRIAFLAMALVIPALVLYAPPAAAVNGTMTSTDGGYWTKLGPYTSFKAGMYFPQAGDVEDFDDAFYAEISFGGRPHPSFATELSVGWTKPERDVPGGTAELTIVPITLNAKVPIPLGPVEPYILGGIGGYWVELDTPAIGKDDDLTFGFQAGAGIDFKITPAMSLGVEGKYIWAEPELFGTDLSIDGLTVTGNLSYRF